MILEVRKTFLLLSLAVAGGLSAQDLNGLRVFYTSNRQGEVEPCGCSTGQNGGLARLRTFLLKERKDPKKSLFVDSGDTFFSTNPLNENRRDQERLRAELIATSYRKMGLDALTPGERDFADGIPTLRELEKKSGARFVASNLSDESGSPIFARSLVLKRGGVSIGILGLADEKAFEGVSGVKVQPPLEAIKELVPELMKHGAEVLILLSHLGLKKDRELAAGGRFALIVGSHSLDFLTKPETVDGTWIVQTAPMGPQIGVAEFYLKDAKKNRHELVELDKKYDGKNDVEKLIVKYKEAVRKLAKSGASFSPELYQSSKAKPYVAHPYYCRTCHQKQYDFWEKTKHASAYLVLFAKNQHFDAECISCHSLGYREPGGYQDITEPFVLTKKDPKLKRGQFVENLMHQVFSEELKKGTLQRLDSRVEPQRYQKLHDRYVADIKSLEEKDALANVYIGVQCEHCHGNRNGHPDSNVKTAKRVSEQACNRCHRMPNAPNVKASDFKKVGCPLSARE